MGVISIGAFAVGGIAIGWMSYGVFAVGQLSLGCFTIGQLTVGLVSLGQLALGVIFGVAQLGLIGFGAGQGYFAVLSSFKLNYKIDNGRIHLDVSSSGESVFLTAFRLLVWLGMWTVWWIAMNIPEVIVDEVK